MKRRLLGVAVTLLASLGSLFAYAPVASANSTGTGCPADTGNTGCTVLQVVLAAGPGTPIPSNAGVHVNRQDAKGQDDSFNLNGGGNTFSSVNQIAFTYIDTANLNGNCNGTPQLFDITVIDVGSGNTIGTASGVNLCRDPSKGAAGKTIRSNITLTGGGKGGINVTLNVKSGTGTKPCTSGTISKPLKLTVGSSGTTSSPLSLNPGDYDVAGICTYAGSSYTFTGKVTVVAGKLAPFTFTVDPAAGPDQGNGATPKPTSTDDTPPPDCDAGAFTWAICPIIHALTDIIDWIRDSIIVPLLKEPPLTQQSNPQAYTIWASMRNVASLFFILVFFLVIIGTAAGFDNYTIKKVLPHLVAGAILVPLSWFICAITIDLGNVLGQGAVVLLSPVIGTPKIDFDTAIGPLFFGAGGLMAIGLAYFAFTTIGLGVLVTVLLAVLSAFITLVGRKILIILFIILSPFALLAWVLPNTEKWFSRWWSNFLRLVMVYPAFMLFVEAGRLFSATSAATFGATASLGGPFHAAALGMPAFAAIGPEALKTVGTIGALAGLWLPVLLFLPFYRKIESQAGAALGKGIEKARGAADNRFGKNSDMAKQAAENRISNSAFRARKFGDQAKTTTGFAKKRNQALERLNARRSGVPKGFKFTRGDQNQARELQREKLYADTMGKRGIINANKLNSEQGLTSETATDRDRAEALLAQTKKRNDRSMRMGIVKDQDEMGGEHSPAMAANNLREYQAGVNNAARNAATARGTLLGNRRSQLTTPQNSRDITEAAIEHGEAEGNAKAAATAGAMVHGANLDNLRLEKENAARAASGMAPINLQQAHQLRMNDAVKAGISKEGAHLLDSEIDVNSVNSKDDDLDREIQKRTATSGGGAITLEEARRLRMGNILKAESSKKRKAGILGESENRTYNEIEAEAGGPESAHDLLESGRLLSRQGMVDERQKRTGALDAQARGQVPTTRTLLRASRDTQSRAFAKASEDQQAIVNDIDNDIVAERAKLERASTAAGSMLPPHIAQARAEANVRNRRVENAGTSALTKGERAAAASVNTEAGVVDDLDNDINDEIIDLQRSAKASGALLPPDVAKARATANVRARRLNNSGTTARTKSMRSSADEIGTEAGVKREVDSTLEDAAYNDIQKAAIAAGGALPENIARSRAQAIVAARNITVAGDTARAKAVRDVNRRELGNVRNTAEGNSAVASRNQVSDAEGSQNSARTQINEEAAKIYAAGGVTQADAQAQAKAIVTRKNLNTAGNAARLAAEDKGRRTNQGNIGISEGFDKRVKDELNANPSAYTGLSTDAATAQAARKVTQRDLDAVGKTAELAGANKFTQDRETDIGIAGDLQSQVRKERNTNSAAYAGLTDAQAQAQAQAKILDSRLTDAGNAARTDSQRNASKQRGKNAGVTRNITRETAKQAKKLQRDAVKAGATLSAADAQAQAAIDVQDRNLGALATKATEEGARSSRQETKEAIGVENAVNAQIKAQTDKLLAGQGKSPSQAKIDAAVAKATDLVEERNLYNAGEAAQITGQRSYTDTASKDKGIVKTNDAIEKRAPVDAARTKARNEAYARLYRAARSKGLSEEAARAEADSVENRKAINAEGERKAAEAQRAVDDGTITREDQRNTALATRSVATQESTERTETNAQANVLALNEAATAPNALGIDERITVQSAAVTQNLAEQSGKERERYNLTRPGQSRNRSYQAVESDAQRPERTRIINEGKLLAGTKDITLPVYKTEKNLITGERDRIVVPVGSPDSYVDPSTITDANPTGIAYKIDRMVTDRIEHTEVDPNNVPQMEKMAEELLTPTDRNTPPDDDRAAAIMSRLTLTNPGREAVRRLQYRVFGRDDSASQEIDPTALNGRAREVWEAATKDVPFEVAADFKAPAQAAYDGFSSESYMKAGYSTKKNGHTFALNQYAEQPTVVREFVKNIAEGLRGPLASKYADADNLQEMYRFLQDPRAAEEMAKFRGVDAQNRPIDGREILQRVYHDGGAYGGAGKIAQRIDDATDARLDAYNQDRISRGLPPASSYEFIPILTNQQVEDYNRAHPASPLPYNSPVEAAIHTITRPDGTEVRVLDDSIDYIAQTLRNTQSTLGPTGQPGPNPEP